MRRFDTYGSVAPPRGTAPRGQKRRRVALEEERQWIASTRVGSTTRRSTPSSTGGGSLRAHPRCSTSVSFPTRSASASGPSECGPTLAGDELQPDSLLFADQGAEAELCEELRLSELWGGCPERPFTMDEFLELSVLVTDVSGIHGVLCADCAMLERPTSAPTGRWPPPPCVVVISGSAWATPRLKGAAPTGPRRARRPPLEQGSSIRRNRAQWGSDVGRPCLRRIAPDRLVRPALGPHGRPLLRQVPLRSDPPLLADIVEALVPLSPQGVDGLAGLELGGAPLPPCSRP